MEMFSKELEIMDRNTVKLMIDEMEEELNETKRKAKKEVDEVKRKAKEEIEEAANLLEIHSEEYYRVVTFYTFQKERGDMYTSEQLRETGINEGEIMPLSTEQLVYRNIDQIVMIQRVDEKQKRDVYLNKMEEMCAALQNAIRYRHKTEKIQVGFGKMVKGIYNLYDV